MATIRVPYSRPATSIEEQLALLRSRGLEFDQAQCKSLLGQVHYFRLTGYLHWFLDESREHVRDGITIGHVELLMNFDRDLRDNYFRLIGIVETRLRSAFVMEVSGSIGPMGYVDPQHAASQLALSRDLAKLQERLTPPTEDYIENFLREYTDNVPPIWMAVEVMSLGLLSKWYDNLASDALRKRIASHLGMPAPVLTSYLRHLTVVRNICAHHGRLWNRFFATQVMMPKNPTDLVWALQGTDANLIYRGMALTAHVVRGVAPTNTARAELKELLISNRNYADEMDVPEGFESDAIWSA